jgi:uncharacterized membrane protein
MSLLTKIIGGIIFAVGLLFVILFPSMRDYQPDRFALTGVIFGVVLMAIGFVLVKF